MKMKKDMMKTGVKNYSILKRKKRKAHLKWIKNITQLLVNSNQVPSQKTKQISRD